MLRQTVLRVVVMAAAALTGTTGVVAVAGCGPADPAPAASSTPTPAAHAADATPTAEATATASAAVSADDRISSTGIGPLVVAAQLSGLQAAGAVGNVQPVAQCPDWTTADGTGDYAFVHATFAKGALIWIEVSTTTVSTVEGAQLGMALDEVAGMYSGKGVVLTNAAGAKGLGVPAEAGAGLLMRTNADDQVNVIEAGSYDLLRSRFVDGKNC